MSDLWGRWAVWLCRCSSTGDKGLRRALRAGEGAAKKDDCEGERPWLWDATGNAYVDAICDVVAAT